eukprot:scaffold241993_cov47-Attheya_sp.AAC.1
MDSLVGNVDSEYTLLSRPASSSLHRYQISMTVWDIDRHGAQSAVGYQSRTAPTLVPGTTYDVGYGTYPG